MSGRSNEAGVLDTVVPVIVAGGGGTRLWPLSRQHYPKQFLNLSGPDSLLQDTLRRAAGEGAGTRPPIVICNEEHRFLVADQMRAISITAQRLILEPVGRNTAPALTIAALEAQKVHGDAVLVMMPADHIIPDNGQFRKSLTEGVRFASEGYLVALGVEPERAEPGYGYIKVGEDLGADSASRLEAFVEKPTLDLAAEYLQSGEYLWNSGIFVMLASAWLDAITACRVEIVDACRKAYSNGTVDGSFYRLDEVAFSECPADSVDFAVMERIDKSSSLNAAVITFSGAWSDVGSWSGLWEVSPQDGSANALSGDVLCLNSSGNLVHADQRFVALAGCEDLVVIETADAVMIAPKSNSQAIRQVVEWLEREGRSEQLAHRKVYRPWGSYESVDVGELHQVKRIIVKPGERLSLQSHEHRAEHWTVVKGQALVTLREKEFLMDEDESTYIPRGAKHRLANPGTEPLEIIEVQTGSYLGEDDIFRYDDKYDRHKATV